MRDKPSNHKKNVILLMALASFTHTGDFFCSMILQTRREYRHFVERRADLENRLAQAHEEFR